MVTLHHANLFHNLSQSFHWLIGDIFKYQDKCENFLLGDLDARIRLTQFTHFEENKYSLWSRISNDHSTNDLT